MKATISSIEPTSSGDLLLLPDDYVVAIDLTSGGKSDSTGRYGEHNYPCGWNRSTGNNSLEDADVDNDDNGFDQRDLGGYSSDNLSIAKSSTLSHFDETEAEADGDKETLGDGCRPLWFGDGQSVFKIITVT